MTDAPAPIMPTDVPLPAQYAQAQALVERLRMRWSARSADTGEAPVELIETHISWVLLTATEAYKFKKPVQLGFLDFGSRAARRQACDEELRVNRRLAPDLYLDVVGFDRAAAGPLPCAEASVLEVAVRMRRFAPDALFDRRLSFGLLTREEVEGFARRIAHFHAHAAVAPPDGVFGQPASIVDTVNATLARLGATGADCADLVAWARHAADRLGAYWRARVQGGHVREGHGDLHLANAVLLPDGPTAFDAIEFDPGLRWIDTMTDFAFALMDFIARGRADLAWHALDAYLEVGGDYAGLTGLRYDLVYRAAIRAMVAGLGAPAPVRPAVDYLACARACRDLGGPPALILMRGWSGSGKSTVAKALLAEFGAVRVRSDVERKRLHGLDALADSRAQVAGGIYDARTTARTYARLAEAAEQALAAGWRVIVDAAFLRRDERAAMRELARRHGLPCLVLECRADPAVLRERLRARQARRDDPSEADESVLARQQDHDEALDADELRSALVVETDGAIDSAALAQAVRARCS